MSGFSSIAIPGNIPTYGSGNNKIDPEHLFKNAEEKYAYKRLLGLAPAGQEIIVKTVKVEIFDLSDRKQVRKYERLWKSLLERAAKGEVVVDARKDLVSRKDGTSFWMKYVEYVDFGNCSEDREHR